MYFWSVTDILLIAGVILIALLTVGIIISRLYQRASKEVAFVRTGLGGQKVVMNGGALVFPILHETIPVNMNTMRLEVRRADDQALITRDRMRVDVLAEFYNRVQPTAESIANAAQTLGQRTMAPDALRELMEGKFVDALRAVAAEMTMEELHEQRVSFVQKVQLAVSEDLLKNGLELESVSLTGLDQTNRDFFNPNNAFDAAGLTRLTAEIEERRKRRNEIEQDAQVAINEKNLEAEQRKFEIAREMEYARLAQEREVEVRRAAQAAEIARERAERRREAEQADIIAKQLIETAEVERAQTIELANQQKAIAVAEKSKAESEAKAQADLARAEAVRAQEAVETVRETEKAERSKAVQLVEARQAAEESAISITVAAEAKKNAAADEAEAIQTLAKAEADKLLIAATSEADAEKLRAAAAEVRYAIDAAGQRALNEADNALNQDIIAMKIKLSTIEHLRDIIRESVRPMEKIDGIKIIQVDGLTNGGRGNGASANGSSGNLGDQLVSSALQYRGQAPLVDALLKEIGLSGGSINGLSDGIVKNGTAEPAETAAAPTAESVADPIPAPEIVAPPPAAEQPVSTPPAEPTSQV